MFPVINHMQMMKGYIMKRLFFAVFLAFLVSVTGLLAINVSASEYDLFHTGRVTFTVEVPDDFDEIVFVSLMDVEGGVQQFPIVPEGDYRLVEDVVCGPYRVSGFVDNDPWFEYTVLRDQEYISVTTEEDIDVKLTVVKGGAGEIIEETAPTFPPETEEVTEPISDDDFTEPEETAPSEVPDNGNDEDSELSDFSWPIWIKILFSLVISLGFALIVIIIVHFIRNRM